MREFYRWQAYCAYRMGCFGVKWLTVNKCNLDWDSLTPWLLLIVIVAVTSVVCNEDQPDAAGLWCVMRTNQTLLVCGV